MKKMELYENQPAEHFWDMHFLGNGNLGMTVKGAPVLEEIYLNEDTLWSGSESFQYNQGHFEAWKEAQELVLEGQLEKANSVVEEKMSGRWSEGYLPMAALHLAMGQKSGVRNRNLRNVLENTKVENYSRRLDLEEAIERVSWQEGGITYRREYFVSAVEKEAYILCEAKKKTLNFAIALESLLQSELTISEGELILAGRAPDHTEPEYTPVSPKVIYHREEESEALRFACSVRVLGTDGKITADRERLYVTEASYAVLGIKGVTNYTGFGRKRDKNLERLKEKLGTFGGSLNVSKKDYEKIKKEHCEDYRKFYDRVELKLPEEEKEEKPLSQRLAENTEEKDDPALAALLLQYSRYLLISGSRPETQAMNLQGIWNHRLNPPWAGNYTTNINLEMNYWASEVLGLPECHLPLFKLMERLAVAGKETAKEYYHLDGWVVHHNTDFWCHTEPGCESARWGWWPMAAAWLCGHLRLHYAFTLDQAFLRKFYPVMEGAVRFYLGFLKENKDGFLVTVPSVSPENAICFNGKRDISVTEGCSMDLELLQELFEFFIQVTKILGEKEELASLAGEALKKFPPLKVGRYGQLQEWNRDFAEDTPGNPHTSHLYGVYPSDLITQEKHPEYMKAAERSLERRILHLRQQNGWGAAWKMGLAARMKRPFLCSLMLKQLYACLGAGLFTKDGQQIDAILGAGAALGEMLLQSHKGYIELLPALPGDWMEGSYRGLRARGGFEVSAKWKNGRVTEASLLSLLGQPCKVKGVKKALSGNESYEAKGEFLEFATEKGREYQLIF